MSWDGIFNVQCVEQKEILISVMLVNIGFVEIIYLDIENAGRENKC